MSPMIPCWSQWRDMKIIYTRKGDEILVDDEDYERLNQHRWCLNDEGYATRWAKRPGGGPRDGYTVRMHREVMGLGYGDPRHVDHKFGVKLDNRKSELRICTNHQNTMNRSAYPHGTSGLKGVTWRPKRRRKWEAYITLHGRKHYLGAFDTAEEAHKAYCEAAPTFHGEFANTTNRVVDEPGNLKAQQDEAVLAPLVQKLIKG